MCDPVSAAYAAVSVATTALSIDQQNKYAQAQADAASNAAQADQIALEEQSKQSQQQTNLEITERQRQALRERGRLITAMGESNVSGNSPLREIANSYQQEAYDTGILETNKENSLYNITTQQASVKATEKSRLNEAASHKTSGLSAAAQIAASGYSGYSSGLSLRRSLNLKGGS